MSFAPLVECVPNFSVAGDGGVVSRLARTVTDAGCLLLDRHSDPDHNRSVLTFAGSSAAVASAAIEIAAVALEEIDLRVHRGAHPRLGALDVLPFTPLGAGTLGGCAAVATHVARELAARFGLPTYLYGAAAFPGRPATVRAIRDGGFEALLALGDDLPTPDFGPRHLHPSAGAVIVGARPALVAFNVVLDVDDLAAARRIARRVRASGGGLPAVQAMAVNLASRGRAQVSMNLLDHRFTGLATVVAECRRLAREDGVEIASAELVGLLPAAALEGTDGLDLPGMPGPSQTIEHRLANPLR